MNIKIDIELKEILDSMNIDKSALINSLLYKFLALEGNIKNQVPSHQTQNSYRSEMIRPRLELGTTRLSVVHSNQLN